MASIKNLKKDIDFLTGLVVTDCLEAIYVMKDIDREAISEIISEILTARKELRSRMNHPDGKDNKSMNKAYFSQIGKDLVDVCDQSYTKLNAVIEKAS